MFMKQSNWVRSITMFIVMLTSSYAFSQNLVSGKVSDNTGKGIPGASIAVGTRGTQTNADGIYSLSLPGGNATIIVSFVGYATASKNVNVSGNITVDFTLIETSAELGEVILTTGSRSLPRSSINTPLPIDALLASDLRTTGQISFDKQLQYRVPSFNTVNTP